MAFLSTPAVSVNALIGIGGFGEGVGAGAADHREGADGGADGGVFVLVAVGDQDLRTGRRVDAPPRTATWNEVKAEPEHLVVRYATIEAAVVPVEFTRVQRIGRMVPVGTAAKVTVLPAAVTTVTSPTEPI